MYAPRRAHPAPRLSTRLHQDAVLVDQPYPSTGYHSRSQYYGNHPYSYPRASYPSATSQSSSGTLLSPIDTQSLHTDQYPTPRYSPQPLADVPELPTSYPTDESASWPSRDPNAYTYLPEPSPQSPVENIAKSSSSTSSSSSHKFATIQRKDSQVSSSGNWTPPPTADADRDRPPVPLSVQSSQSEDTQPPKSAKPKRQKPHIALAPNQPPTTQGKPRARVYVACLQCRQRKTRCDGAKPVCHNCSKRANGGDVECNYDTVPKRRGPDRTPGARQRSNRGIQKEGDGPRRRRKSSPNNASDKQFDDKSSTNSPVEIPQIPSLTIETTTEPQEYLSPTSANTIDTRSPLEYLTAPLSSDVESMPHTQMTMIRGHPSSAHISRNYSESPPYDVSYEQAGILLTSSPTYAFPFQYTVEDEDDQNAENMGIYQNGNVGFTMASEPSMVFARKTWWDSLLTMYTWSYPNPTRALTNSEREETANMILRDVRFCFKASNCWFSFFHLPTFFGTFCDPVKRENMQPSLVLALLAVAMFFNSSEQGGGERGRARSMRLRAEAQGALEASFNAGWIDDSLAQAAWLLALFEVCAHPEYTKGRALSAMVMLDNIIRSLTLTLLDANDPDTTVFYPRSVPIASHAPENIVLPQAPLFATLSADTDAAGGVAGGNSLGGASGCDCRELSLGSNWQGTQEYVPIWDPTPGWDPDWTEAEIRKESCRRLCWSSMTLAAAHMSYAPNNKPAGTMFFISDPSNYAMFFSGEILTKQKNAMGLHPNPKDTIWAVHERCYLLWHSCVRMRHDDTATNEEKAQFSLTAWLEADALEASLNRHTCGYERAIVFQGREYIFNTRMCISHEFRRSIPLVPLDISGFYRQKAEEWLAHQRAIAKGMIQGLHTVTGNQRNTLTLRPFFVFWLMGLVANTMRLYQRDTTLTVALDLCMSLLPCIDFLSSLWPCGEQRKIYAALRSQVEQTYETAQLLCASTNGMAMIPSLQLRYPGA